MSSKKPVSRFQQVVEVPKKVYCEYDVIGCLPVSLIPSLQVVRDPRFDERSGHFNSGLFSKAYSFLDEYKAKEKQAGSQYYILTACFIINDSNIYQLPGIWYISVSDEFHVDFFVLMTSFIYRLLKES